MPRVDIHLVSWQRPKMTKLVIETIRRNTKPGSYRLVVTDNGSDLDTAEILREYNSRGVIDELHLLRRILA